MSDAVYTKSRVHIHLKSGYDQKACAVACENIRSTLSSQAELFVHRFECTCEYKFKQLLYRLGKLDI